MSILQTPTVPLSEIRSALASVWNTAARLDAGASAADGGRPARMRARLSNVIIVMPPSLDAAARRQVDSLIEELCIAHPSRFFVIELRKTADAGAPIEAAVNSRCVLARSGEHVCSEEIYLFVREQGIEHVPHLLLSHLVHDVAAQILLIGNPLDADSSVDEERVIGLLRSIDEMSDRVIFDSSQFADFGECLRAIVDSHDTAGPPVFEGSLGVSGVLGDDVCKFRDVNWRRLRRWRVLLREQFDLERFQSLLPSLEAVELSSAGSEGGTACAVLLAAWMLNMFDAEEVSVTRDSESVPSVSFTASLVRSACITLSHEAQGAADDGSILEIRFRFADEHFDVLSLRREPELDAVSVSLEADGVAELVRRVSFSEPAFTDLLLQDVISNDKGGMFLDVFNRASALARALKSAKGA